MNSPSVRREPDAKQRVRIRRLGLAAGASLVTIAIALLTAWFGHLPARAAAIYTALVTILGAGFYAAFRSGLNLRFRDRNLNAAQFVASTLAISYLVYEGGEARPSFMAMYLIAYMFGAFSLSRRGLVGLALFVLACYAGAVGLSLALRPSPVQPEREWLYLAVFVLLLCWMVVLGFYVTDLRDQLRRTRKEEDSARRRLEESNARFRDFANTSSDWFWEQDAEYRFTSISGEADAKSGVAASTYIGRKRWHMPALNLTEEDWAEHRAALERREPFRDFVMRRPDVDGRERWVAVSGNPVFAEDGSFQGYRGTGRDITAAVMARRESELVKDRLERALQASNAAVWECDLRSGEVLLSEGYAKMMHDSAGPMRMSVEEFLKPYHPEDRPKVRHAVFEAIREPNEQYGVDARMRDAEGELHWLAHRGSVTERDSATGRALRLSGSILDITERKRAEEIVRASEARLADAQRLAKIGSFVRYVDTGRARWSAEMHRIFDVDPSQVPSFDVALERIHPEDRDSVRQAQERLIAGEEQVETRYRVVHRDGDVRHVLVRSRPLRGADGSVERVVGTVQDVTERNAMESRILKLNESLERRVAERTMQLQAANRELEGFSYTVSHDLRAPLRVMASYATLLGQRLGGSSAPEVLDYLQRIENNAVKMGRLIDDLLAFSRAGREDLRRGEVDMAGMVAEVLRDLEHERVAGTEISVGPLPAAQGDVVMLRQVWQNLIGNALKFTRNARSPRIEIGGGRNDGMVRYWVRDNGMGFDMRYRNKLFGVFERLHSESEAPGLGVGLAIVKRIVERHGGTVDAEGKPGEGAEFSFSLPPSEASGDSA